MSGQGLGYRGRESGRGLGKGSGKGLRSLTGKWWGLGVGRAWETGAALRGASPPSQGPAGQSHIGVEESPSWERRLRAGDCRPWATPWVVILRLRAWLGRWDPSISINGCPVPLRHAGSPRRSSLVRRGPMGIRLQAYPVFTVPGVLSPRGPGVAPSGDG